MTADTNPNAIKFDLYNNDPEAKPLGKVTFHQKDKILLSSWRS